MNKTVIARLSLVCVSLIVMSLMLTGISDAKFDLTNAIGIWLFDEGAGEVAKDSSGNGNDGELMNGANWVEGKFGTKALSFDGSDDWVNFGDASDVLDVGTGEITVVYWIYPKAKVGSYLGHVRLTAPNTVSRFESAFQNSNLQIYTNDGQWHDTGETLDLNKWSHVVWTKVGTTLKLYINGQDTGWSMSHTASLGPFNNMMFGKHIDCFEGILDEVAIFNVGLTKNDIQDIMAQGLEGAGAVDLSGKLPTTWASIKNQ